MQPTSKELLLEILGIIRYTKNKDRFIQEFEAMNHLEAITNLLEKFPQDIREKIKLFAFKKNIEGIKDYISSDTYGEELRKVSEKELKSIIEVMTPILSFDQRQKIHRLMSH